MLKEKEQANCYSIFGSEEGKRVMKKKATESDELSMGLYSGLRSATCVCVLGFRATGRLLATAVTLL